MVFYCCIFTCPNRRRKADLFRRDQREPENGGKATFHPFPWRYPTVLQAWVDAIRPYIRTRNADRWEVKRYSRVCSDHFLPSDYLPGLGFVDDTRVLKNSAVPSRFAGCIHADNLDNVSADSTVENGISAVPKSKNKSSNAYCAALGCPSKFAQSSEDPERSFHQFPYARPVLMRKWEAAVGRKDFKATYCHRLCSRHFTRNSFLNRGIDIPYRKLKRDAVPTVFRLPPLEMLDQVDPSAPYLQPRVLLNRVDEPDELSYLAAAPRRGVPPPAATLDHTYQMVEVDTAGEVSRIKLIIEALKDQIMSTSHKVKSLKINVSALKHQYQLEKELFDRDAQDR